MAKEQIKRLKAIKIRVSEEELASLRAGCPKAQLAEWMREHCLGFSQSRRATTPTVDPVLLRQIAGIGNNLNQIARRVNGGQWSPQDKVSVMAALMAIDAGLERVRHAARENTDDAG